MTENSDIATGGGLPYGIGRMKRSEVLRNLELCGVDASMAEVASHEALLMAVRHVRDNPYPGFPEIPALLTRLAQLAADAEKHDLALPA